MKSLLLCFSILISIVSFSQDKNEIAIIPEPVSLSLKAGKFVLPPIVLIQAPNDPALKQGISFLSNRISVPTGRTVKTASNLPGASIKLLLNKTSNNKIGSEGYTLTVTPKTILITANQPAGLFYGIQTLLQLFPKESESKTAVKNISWQIPVVEITDYPRFGWRGLMFDVTRHFFTKAEVMQFIDQMVRYKYNLLHLHLSDDEGWRVEIKSLPNLTKVGAWRVNKVGYFGTFTPPLPDEPKDYGGFYTQDDIREIVKYAKDRFVNVLPEIDVPGHSLAAVVSYPEISCTEEAKNYRVRSGEQIMDWSKGAPPIALVDNTLCPANEKAYEFLDKVFTEIAALFPFDYIHMGGDETPKNYWEKMPEIKALMEREGLKDMHEVQSYFVKRVEKIVTSKGKKLIGWDEILEGGLAPSAAVMSWRGMKGGIEAANMKHEVVMSPTDYAYLDYMQGDPITEPRVYASLRLNKAYTFDPMPPGVDPQYIKGAQGNIWSEQLYNLRTVQYMIWPRAFALAETVWSPAEKKNWNSFFNKVGKHFERFDVAEIKYSPAMYDPILNVSRTDDKKLKIELTTEGEGLDIYYSFDNSYPDRFYPKYSAPLVPPKDAYQLKMITYKGNQPVGRMMAITIEDLNKRADARR
ncbi:MAG: beta-N-acetylhexosaminidase [Flavisolibacter sp.]